MYFQIGLDGYNLLLVMLTVFLGPLVVAGSFTAIQKDVKLFYAMVFLIQFAMLGAFVAQDLFLFYLFWEAMMIPMFFIIGIWGGERRIYATIKFVLYTAFGSILMLAAVIYLVYSLNATSGVTSFAFADLYRAELPLATQVVLLAAFGLSFAIKVPIVPLHTWLPDAHVEAPTAGSVILAGVLLKMGTYGFMKLGFPLFPDATRLLAPFFSSLAVVSIVYGACLALVQTDIKKIIAYSSISHLGFVMLGLISLDLIGIQGAVIQMVSHGLVAGGLFLLVGMVYERCHTRELAAYGGLAKLMPVYSIFVMVLTLAAIGLPTTSGFTGEFLVLLGAFSGAWPQYQNGTGYPLLVSAIAVAAWCWERCTCWASRNASCSALRRRRISRSPTSACAKESSWRRLSSRCSGWGCFPPSPCARPSSRRNNSGSWSPRIERERAPRLASRAKFARRPPRRRAQPWTRTRAADELGKRAHLHAAREHAAGRHRLADRPRDLRSQGRQCAADLASRADFGGRRRDVALAERL